MLTVLRLTSAQVNYEILRIVRENPEQYDCMDKKVKYYRQRWKALLFHFFAKS